MLNVQQFRKIGGYFLTAHEPIAAHKNVGFARIVGGGGQQNGRVVGFSGHEVGENLLLSKIILREIGQENKPTNLKKVVIGQNARVLGGQKHVVLARTGPDWPVPQHPAVGFGGGVHFDCSHNRPRGTIQTNVQFPAWFFNHYLHQQLRFVG